MSDGESRAEKLDIIAQGNGSSEVLGRSSLARDGRIAQTEREGARILSPKNRTVVPESLAKKFSDSPSIK
jgi:hypothetical protein